MKTRTIFLTIMAVFTLAIVGCTEELDDSCRYVFKERTITDYLNAHEQYSDFCDLLKRVPASKLTQTTLKQLLSARGHYTVFAPTNEAIQAYLEELAANEDFLTEPSWDAFTDSTKLDSIRKEIVYNSIIDCGDEEEAYQTTDFPVQSNGEFARSNMNGVRLTVRYVNDPDSIYLNQDCPVNELHRDMYATNGIVHEMEKVLTMSRNSLTDLLYLNITGKQKGFCVMAKLCLACGLMDTLSMLRDYTYEEMYLQGRIGKTAPANGMASVAPGFSTTPEHRKYGFTIFAEPDEFWEEQIGKDATEITPEDVQAWVAAQNYYPEATQDDNYTDEGNLLNLWTTYHIVDYKMAANRLIFHFCEYGYNYHVSTSYTIPVMEYYTTLGKRRLLKIYESPEAGGIFLNRFPKIDNRRRGTGREIGCDPEKVGCHIDNTDPKLLLHSAENGYLYRIDRPLAFSTEVRDNLGKERIRMDGMSWFPEAMNNDIRCLMVNDDAHGWVHIPEDKEYHYFQNLSINEGSTFVYCNGYGKDWGNYCADEIKCVGRWELLFKLPPFPKKGMYEIRYRVLATDSRGVAQIYFGSDPDKLPAAGIPVDLRRDGSDPTSGWRSETEDDEFNAETDRQMRNKGFMKGEKAIDLPASRNNSRSDYCQFIVRRIIVRQMMDPDKTYYLKFKALLDTEIAEFYMDVLEYCPKEVYDNPVEPEDVW